MPLCHNLGNFVCDKSMYYTDTTSVMEATLNYGGDFFSYKSTQIDTG